jgi:hypothetical protein
MSAPATFDPENPDGAILEAFENIRANRAWIYSWDAGRPQPEIEKAIEDGDAAQQELEAVVGQNFATTIPGVLTKLQLSLAIMSDRWVDRTMVEAGVYGLYRKVDDLDGKDALLVHAMNELLHIEWEQNLAAYERSHGDLRAVLRLGDIADEETFRLRELGQEPAGLLAEAIALSEALAERFCNMRAIRKLICTLAPDQAAYRRKVEIVMAEGVGDEAVIWLARDAHYLIGRIDSDADLARRSADALGIGAAA